MTQNSIQPNYAKAFRIVRAAYGLRQSDLAERMPITPSQLSLIEAGKRQPSLRVINGLASAVGIPTALISLLASTSEDMESQSDADIYDLSRALLRLLVTASESPQRSMSFENKDK